MGIDKSSRRTLLFVAFAIVAIGFLAGNWFFRPVRQPSNSDTAPADVKELVQTEKLVLRLQRDLDQLSASCLNLQLPDWRTKELFAPRVLVRDLLDQPRDAEESSNPLGLMASTWPASRDEPVAEIADNLLLLQRLMGGLAYFDHCKLKLVKGQFTDAEKQEFVADVSLSGLAKVADANSKRSVHGMAVVHWRFEAPRSDEPSQWRISEWLQGDLAITERPTDGMFQDVLPAVIPAVAERESARRSIHEELVVEMFKNGRANLPGPKFKHEFDFVSSGYHPGLAVVDVDSDGWDDLYVMSRWGRNQLFLNLQNGTFQEVASDYGLDIEAHCTSAVFADFDNDGDPDLFLGRSALPSIYMVNESGRFVDRSSDLVKTPLPALVSSVSAADFNNDGLLDVYFSTYGHRQSLVKELLPRHQLVEFARRVNGGENHVYLDGVGAPNLLLANRGGGKFDRAPDADQLEFWQTTFQSTWSDYDRDGDVDLYVSNDFGPDRLMRNDQAQGFSEVTEEFGHQTMTGFGMGATWGDYDLDGLQDLYVSNMFSKAGMRITENVEGIDPRFRSFASGNRLYRQTADGFDYVSGLKPPKMLVAKAGWSWGGQFTDLDNDGYLDIYVTSGYFTAPDEVAAQDDL